MKVLFLDVDGVLNSQQYTATHPDADLCSNDPDAVLWVLRILALTGAKVVLTSSWRTVMPEIIAPIPLFDVTPRLDAFGARSAEIAAWLAAHPDVTDFAIVDDDADAGYDGLAVHFVLVNDQVGLVEAPARALMAILNGVAQASEPVAASGG